MNAANPNLPEFRFQARHLIPLTRLTGNFAAIDHIENSLGRVAFSIPKTNDSDTKTIQDDLLETISDFGKLVQDTSETLLPGHIRADEVKRLEGDAFQLMRDLAHFIDDLKKTYAHLHPGGRPAVPEVPETVDPDTGEIIQEYISAIPEIEPLPETITVATYDEYGNKMGEQTVPNPPVVKDEQERLEAQAIIDSADTDTLNIVGYRKGENELAYISLEAIKTGLQERNRAECRARILAKYPVEIQLSMGAGIYSSDEITAYQDFVANCIAEENRVFNLIENSTDPETFESPIWPEA